MKIQMYLFRSYSTESAEGTDPLMMVAYGGSVTEALKDYLKHQPPYHYDDDTLETVLEDYCENLRYCEPGLWVTWDSESQTSNLNVMQITGTPWEEMK